MTNKNVYGKVHLEMGSSTCDFHKIFYREKVSREDIFVCFLAIFATSPHKNKWHADLWKFMTIKVKWKKKYSKMFSA